MALLRSGGKCSAKESGKSRRVAVLAAVLLAVPAPAPAHAKPQPETNVAVENRKPGTPGWELRNPAVSHEIEGYAGAASAAPGDTVSLHVSSASPRFTVEVYRMGWYGGAGARLVRTLANVPGGRRPVPAPRAGDGLIECRWPVSCRVPVGPDWVSGVYLARLTGARDGKQSFVPFVVREQPLPAKGVRILAARARFLIQCSVNTWQAYNDWGGKSLYDFNSTGGRAVRVSFDRPYATSQAASPGAGAGEFLSCAHAPRAGGWEYPFVRWIERQGYDVAYATNVDVHSDPMLLAGRSAFLSVGHDEYWSRAMRDQVERARDRGVNLGIFSSNVCYWQVRYEPSAGGTPDRILFCAKDPDRDPWYNTDKDRDLTVHFHNLHPRRPEVSLVGMMMSAEGVEGDFTPLPEARRHWLYAGTGIASGRMKTVPGLLGYEVDRSFTMDSTWARYSPKGLTVLARAWVQEPGKPRVPTETTVYTAPSGAVVFAAGTMQWSWGLDDWGAPRLHPARAHPDIERITKNLLGRFLGGVRARGPRSPG